jgi:spore coat polysaccharide biosynthesis protein SpsF
MEAGQLNNMKVGAVIQARMQSTRLPGKVLMPLPIDHDDSALLTWIVNELKKSKLINTIVLATSLQPENNVLKSFAEQSGIEYYAGSEEDVLSRITDVIEQHNLDVVIRLTGDNPVIDIHLLNEIIKEHIASNNDYTYSADLPLGMNMEIASAASLLNVSKRENLTDEDKEHVTFYFKRHEGFRISRISFSEEALTQRIRLTVDYPADYAVVNLVTQVAVKTGLSGMQLVKFIDSRHPWIWSINENILQKRQFLSEREELKYDIDLLKNHDLKFSNSILTRAWDEKGYA